MNMKKIAILAIAAAFSLNLAAQNNQTGNVLNLKQSITDPAIVYPESFEADTQKLLEGWYLKNYTDTDKRYATDKDPGASDDLIKARLAEMQTIIEMPFNQIVRSYIDRYLKGRSQVSALVGLSTYYMPIFEQALEEAQLPLELKYLPVIESGLNPNAVSKSGATGLWQFMLATAKGLGMEVTSLVDERCDPYIASEKACCYLKELYKTYGKWDLAIAAYNCGPGNVNKALRRAGGEAGDQDYWSIYYYLPAETRGYVPMFIAANYVMTYYPHHNISPVLPTKPVVTDSVHVDKRIHFDQISKVLNIPVEEIRILNPQFRQDIIPASANRRYNLVLPMQQVQAFIVSEDEIVAYEKDLYAQRTEVTPGGNPEDAISEEPYNPADLAPKMEEEANNEVVQEEQRTQGSKARPRRNRNNNETAQTTTASQTVSESTKAETASTGSETSDKTTPQSKRRQRRENINPETAQTQPTQTQPAQTQTTTKQQTPKQTNSNQQTAQSNNNNKKQTKQQNNNQQTAQNNNNKKQTKQQNNNQQTAQNNNNKKQTKQQNNNQQTAQNNKKGGKQQNNQQTAQNNKKGGKQQNNQQQGKQGKQGKQQANNKQHEVKQGESLSTIASKNGMTVEELRKQNPQIKNADMIHPGDKLNVNKSQNKKGKDTKANQQNNTKGKDNKAAQNNKKGNDKNAQNKNNKKGNDTKAAQNNKKGGNNNKNTKKK